MLCYAALSVSHTEVQRVLLHLICSTAYCCELSIMKSTGVRALLFKAQRLPLNYSKSNANISFYIHSRAFTLDVPETLLHIFF